MIVKLLTEKINFKNKFNYKCRYNKLMINNLFMCRVWFLN